MINEYINKKNEFLKKQNEKSVYIFGLCFGFILLFVNIYFFLSSAENVTSDIINLIFIIIGCVFILLATIYPNCLKFVYLFFQKIFGFIGFFLFKIILFFLYYIFVVPIGIILNKKTKNISLSINSNFEDYCVNDKQVKVKGIYSIFKIFKIFANDRYFLMLPLIIVLILLGVILIFAQSSVIAPFIYTLF